MDEIKRKISEEFDASGDAELSSDLRNEIETSGELKDYADDLIKVEGVLHALRDAGVDEPEWDSLHDEISRSMDVDGDFDASLLEAPMPDGEKDDALPANEPVEEKKPPKTDAEPEDEGPRQRLTSAKTTAKGESSGVINLGALVEEHRKSMAPTGGGLDAPSGTFSAGVAPQQKSSKMLPIAIAAGVLIIVGIAGAFMYSKAKSGQGDAVDMEALRAQLKEELKDEYKAQILAELKAKGMSTEEAEAEAERQAEVKAAEEAEKQAAEAAEAAAEGDEEAEELLASSAGGKKKKKKKKKSSTGGESTTATNTYTAPKTTPKKTSSKKAPSSAGDDLAALLEGATGSKKKGGSDLSKPKKTTTTAPAEKSTVLTPKTNPNLPKTLAKADIRKSMNKIKPRILKCGDGKLGTLMLALVVNSDGSVKSAKVSGKFATDPAGKCAENVAKTAKFPPFQNATASVTYPFVFAPKPGQ